MSDDVDKILANVMASRAVFEKYYETNLASKGPGEHLCFDAALICVKLGLSNTFLTNVIEERDISFVLKLHAILEASLNFLLERKLDRGRGLFDAPSEAIRDLVFKLPLEGRTGKVDLAKRHKFLPTHCIQFIKAVSIMRNQYVHDIKSLEVPIQQIMAEQTKNDANFANKACIPMMMKDELSADTFHKLFSDFDDDPHFGLWLSALLTLASIWLSCEPDQSALKKFLHTPPFKGSYPKEFE